MRGAFRRKTFDVFYPLRNFSGKGFSGMGQGSIYLGKTCEGGKFTKFMRFFFLPQYKADRGGPHRPPWGGQEGPRKFHNGIKCEHIYKICANRKSSTPNPTKHVGGGVVGWWVGGRGGGPKKFQNGNKSHCYEDKTAKPSWFNKFYLFFLCAGTNFHVRVFLRGLKLCQWCRGEAI